MTPRSSRDDLRWLLDVVWAGEGTIGGGHGDEAYLVLPGADRPRFLLPASSRRAAAAMLAGYNRLRPPRTRAARAAAALAARAGMLPLLSGDRVTVRSTTGSLVEHLRVALNRGELVVASGIRRRGLLTKPVLQLFDPTGEPVGYAKIGWNDATRAAVSNEARALSAVAATRPRAFRVPRVIHHGAWRDLLVTVIEPLPSDVRGHRPADRLPATAVLGEVARADGSDRTRVAGSSWLSGLQDRLAAGGEDASTLAERIEGEHGATEVELGRWHGDLTPWNMAWAGTVPYLIDWEHSASGVPVGLDVLHFHFQVAFVLERRELAEAHRVAVAKAPPALRDLGLTEEATDALRLAHLAELLIRTTDAARSGAAPSPRLLEPLRTLIREVAGGVGARR